MLDIFLLNLKNNLNKGKSLIIILLLSLLLILALYPVTKVIEGEMEVIDEIPIALVNRDDSQWADIFLEQIGKSDSVRQAIKLELLDEEDGFSGLEQGKFDALIFIPDNFVKNIQTGNFTPLKIHLSEDAPFENEVLENVLDSATYLMKSTHCSLNTINTYIRKIPNMDDQMARNIFNGEMYSLLLTILARDDIYDRSIQSLWGNISSFEFYSISLLFIMMAIYSLSSGISYLENEDKMVNTRLLISNIDRFKIILIHILSFSILIFIQGLIIGLPFILFNKTSILNKILILGLAALFLASLPVLSALIFKDVKNMLVGTIGFYTSSFIISGYILPNYYINKFIPGFIRYLLPSYWWHQGMIGLINPIISTLFTALFTITILFLIRGIANEKTRYI